MLWESSGVVGFDLGPLLQGQMRIAKLKSAYNSLIIGPTGFGALSLRWIQFASVLRCARSSCFYNTKARMYEKINVIVINSIFDMGTLDNAIGIKATRHIIKCSFSSVLW